MIGETKTILPAYEMSTRAQTRVDGFTGRTGLVLRQSGADALLELADGTEVWMSLTRLA